ncbi:MAG: hypothetical protein HY659_14760 [Rhizobiales bacterium]|nr:hypothetical protein [Hyphomicrobiales bacterium]
MQNAKKFEIACYMAWSGTEATFRFDDENQYNAARSLLNRIAKGHLRSDELSPGFSNAVTDFYFIEEQDRAAFHEAIRDAK